MRKLLYGTCGLALGCAFCVYLLSWEYQNVMAIAFLLISAIFFTVGIRRPFVRRFGLMALGFSLGVGWFGAFSEIYLRFPEGLEDDSVTASIRANDYAEETAYGSAFDGTVVINSRPYQVRVYLDGQEAIRPGTRVEGAFRFCPTTRKEQFQNSYYEGKGIFLLAYQRGDLVLSQEKTRWYDVPAVMRQWLKKALNVGFSEDTLGFAKALLLGDTDDLSYQVDTDLKISGIRHVAAVSGLHVSILFTLITTLSRRRKWLTTLFGLPMLLLFAALAGFTPSVNRACIMSALMLLALLLNREYDAPTALSFAVLVMLIINPAAVCSVSLQLSVASVAGILLLGPIIGAWLERVLKSKKQGKRVQNLIHFFSGSVSVSLSSCFFTIPLSAWHFGAVSLIGPLTNLLTLWVISFIFYGILAVCAAFALSQGAAALLGWLVGWPIRYVLLVARWIADFPMAAIYTCSGFVVTWLIVAYCMVGVFALERNKHPVQLAACLALSLFCALSASWAAPRMDNTRLTVLDVGQGQCLLLQSGGKNYIVDCGGDDPETTADAAAERLLSMGITRLDALILTHTDRDHCCGVENLLTRVHLDLLILPQQRLKLEKMPDCQVIYADRDIQISDENSKLSIFTANHEETDNEMSLVILFDTEKCDILITGDRSMSGERKLLSTHSLPDVDVLIAGHHGSADSTSEELLHQITPEIVCVSAGLNNRYGHPATETLWRLAQFGCKVYRTDLQGTIIVRG